MKKQGDKGRVVKRQGERLRKGKKGGDKGRMGERQGERLKKIAWFVQWDKINIQ